MEAIFITTVILVFVIIVILVLRPFREPKIIKVEKCINGERTIVFDNSTFKNEPCTVIPVKEEWDIFTAPCSPGGMKNGEPCVQNGMGVEKTTYTCVQRSFAGENKCVLNGKDYSVGEIVTTSNPCILRDLNLPVC